MSGSWQLGALMKKNLILMKRSCCATTCEIVFPIILMILLVMVRRAIKIEEFGEPLIDSTFLNSNSTALINPGDINAEPGKQQHWYGMPIRDPLY